MSQTHYINFIIKMHKTKPSISQNKSKPKINLSTSTNKKSTNKTKDRPSPCSPRANRIHTLEAKTSPNVLKKIKCTTNQQTSPHTPSGPHTSTKGYETPKFKCEWENQLLPPVTNAPQNFFSFGQKQQNKMTSIRGMRDREKQNYAGIRELNRPRKETRLR